jgi:outer membrane protein OmpA-like peptidoglycan-associated protein
MNFLLRNNSRKQAGIVNKSLPFLVTTFVAVFSAAWAQAPTEPIITPLGQCGLKYIESAKTLGAGRLVFSASGDMSFDPSQIQFVNVDLTSDTRELVQQNYQYGLVPALGFGITRLLDFSLALPVYIDWTERLDSLGPRKVNFGGLQGGLGDLDMKLKLQLPPRNGPRVVDIAYLLGMSLPTGNKAQGFFPARTYYFLKDSSVVTGRSGDTAQAISGFLSSGVVEIEGKVLLTFNCWEHDSVIPLQLHVNIGARIIPARGFDDLLLFGVAAEYRPAAWISLYTEASAEPRIGSIAKGFAVGNDPLRISPGLAIHLPEGMFLTLGGDWGLSSHDPVSWEKDGSYVSSRRLPDLRLSASVGWTGLMYKAVPGKKKVRKGGDSDGDGVPDSLDKCSAVPEDKDGFEDDDGCPDYDNDKDAIPDTVDQCPNDPEDYDDYKDKDGCPDPDNDNDGVCDPWVAEKHLESMYEKICKGIDKCPNMPEDMDGFEDQDGCPDYDNDLDGVPDSLDKCPNEPGPADNQGCPKAPSPPAETSKVKEIKQGRLILRGVEFKGTTADLTSESYAKLDEVFESLKAYPETRIEICGYTDNAGVPAASKKLSLRRAETVRAYLILRGIDSSRITAVGKGEEDPITSNATPEGRAFNRRIEMKRID